MATRKAWLLRLLVGFGVAVPLAATAMYFINPLGIHSLDPRQRLTGYGIYRMPSASMAPTLNPGDVILGNMTHYQEQVPQRGDLVLLWPPESGSPWVKRVIGLPGESVAIHEGKLSINGNVLTEPYVVAGVPLTPYSLEVASTTIADDSYYLLGDNRDHSHDSRIWGPIPHDRLAGKVAYILK